MVDLELLIERFGGALAPATGAARDRAPVDIRDVRLDSRNVGAGDLFAALPGRAADGARFSADAIARGAAAVLSPALLPTSLGVPNWVHPAARRVAGEVAACVQGSPSHGMCVVAVTGTNGKTTTAHLAGQLLAHVGLRVAVLGTTGHTLADGVRLASTHTTPDATELQRLLARHRQAGGNAVSLEMSSHALDQERHAGLEISVAVFTNLTRDHLDYHGDFEHYAAAKRRLFEALRPGTCAVLNAADPASQSMARAAAERGARVLTYGIGSRADLMASRVASVPGGTSFFLEGMGIQDIEVFTSLPGRHNVENVLAALAAVLSTGASPSHALGGLAALSSAPGRLERVPAGNASFVVLVDYAHTPDALERALTTVRETLGPGGRLIVVFGCGGDRDAGKRAPMGAIAARLADLVLVTSDNPRSEDPQAIVDRIAEGALGERARRAEVRCELDRRRAIEAALRGARAGDAVLIAGKGHETTQILAAATLPFDDRQVAREILDRMGEGR